MPSHKNPTCFSSGSVKERGWVSWVDTDNGRLSQKNTEPELDEDISIRLEGKKYTQKWVSYEKYIEKIAGLKAENKDLTEMIRLREDYINKLNLKLQREIQGLKAELAESNEKLKKVLQENEQLVNDSYDSIPRSKVQAKIKELEQEGGKESTDKIHWSNVIAVLEELLSGKEKEQ